ARHYSVTIRSSLAPDTQSPAVSWDSWSKPSPVARRTLTHPATPPSTGNRTESADVRTLL
ncbi:MAG: hypothetical protein L0L93_15290, partial [Brevibacterium sp.]|nr:hypothetical protein [Brevibacterium sp.]